MSTELYKFEIRNYIETTYLKVKESLEDLEKNYPHKVELIKSMQETRDDLIHARVGVRIFCDELSKLANRNYDLERLNLSLQHDLNKMELLNKNLSDRVQL